MSRPSAEEHGTPKRVLLVSYHFPPDTAVGALRCAAFAKYLPSLGWQPYVLTVRAGGHASPAEASAATLQGATICRTAEVTNPRVVALGLRARLHREKKTSPQPTSSFGWGPSDEHRRGMLARLRRWVFSLCWLPDGHLGWLVPAVAAGLRMCRKHRIDVIVSSGPPHTAHLVALLLKRFTQLPWIADFRDPWTQNPAKPAFVRSAFSDWVERGLERRVLASADRLVTVNHRAAAALALRQASLATRTTTIMTGFDPNEFDSIGPVSSAEAFTLAHVGSVYLHRSPTALLQALALLTRSRGIPLGAIRLVFVGEDLSGLADTLHIADRLGISSLVTAPGPVRRTDALAWMRRANLLVLLAQGQPLQIPTKAFEYLASGTPILAIVDDGATADLMHATNNRTVPDDPVKIAEAIAAHLDRRSTPLSASSAPWRRSAVRQFTREHSSEALVALMESSLHAGSYR